MYLFVQKYKIMLGGVGARMHFNHNVLVVDIEIIMFWGEAGMIWGGGTPRVVEAGKTVFGDRY